MFVNKFMPKVHLLDLEGRYLSEDTFQNVLISAVSEFVENGAVPFQIPAVSLFFIDGENNITLEKTPVGWDASIGRAIFSHEDKNSALKNSYRFNYSDSIHVSDDFNYEADIMTYDTKKIAVAKEVYQGSMNHPRLMKNNALFRFPMLTTIYLARFDGRLDLTRARKTSVQAKIPLEELCERLKYQPQLFTPVVDRFIGRYALNQALVRYQ